MVGVFSRRWWLFAVLGLVFLSTVNESQAWDRPPVKVNTVFQFRVEVKLGPEVQRPTAPWYAYFPADPRMQMSPQTSPYPPWPGTFPPPGAPSAPPKAAQNRPRDAFSTAGPMLTQHWNSYATYGTPIQPVGYVPTQAPSYWYQNR